MRNSPRTRLSHDVEKGVDVAGAQKEVVVRQPDVVIPAGEGRPLRAVRVVVVQVPGRCRQAGRRGGIEIERAQRAEGSTDVLNTRGAWWVPLSPILPQSVGSALDEVLCTDLSLSLLPRRPHISPGCVLRSDRAGPPSFGSFLGRRKP